MIKRTPLRWKPKKPVSNWRTNKVRLGPKEYAELKWRVFGRAAGRCENHIEATAFVQGEAVTVQARCPNRISWGYWDPHHIQHTGRGGSDTEENIVAVCWDCHNKHHHGGPKISKEIAVGLAGNTAMKSAPGATTALENTGRSASPGERQWISRRIC